MSLDMDRFIKAVIAAGGWELHYSPQRQPFAVLPEGFGNYEAGIKLLFMPSQGQIRVTGGIDHSDKLRIKRPFVFISPAQNSGDAAQIIKRVLIPQYQTAWLEAQPKIQAYLHRQAEREQATEELRRTLNLYQHLDIDRGVEVLSGNNVEVILNNNMTVALKLQVPHDLAVEILERIKRYRGLEPAH